MKRVLFCLSDFRQGGIPRCLQSLLEQLDTTKVKADVLCLYQDGPYKGNLKNCTVLPEDYIVSRLMVHTKKITLGNFLRHIPAIILKCFRAIINKLFNKDLLTIKLHRIAKKYKAYDVAIAYAEGFPAQVVENIVCRRKLVWIHNDYSWDCAKGGASQTSFSVFDKVVCVSEATRQSWVACYPQYSEKTTTLYNIINANHIIEKSEQVLNDPYFSTELPVIISLGRVCYQKQFDAIPKIASELKDSGIKFRWYIIGSGQQAEVALVKKNIKEHNVEDCVILLGARDNPYPYIKHSNVFVLTSRYESYPTVINEATVLRVPIVANDIPCVREMLHDEHGMIADLPHIADAIANTLSGNSSKNFLLKQSLSNSDSHNKTVMNDFYALLDQDE